MLSKHKPLPPETTAGDGTPEDEALGLIKEILASTDRLIFPDGYVRSPGFIGRGPDVIIKDGRGINSGKLVYRIRGKAGADLTHYPVGVENDRRLQAYLSGIEKVRRLWRLLTCRNKAVLARKRIAEQRASEVMALFRGHDGQGRGLAVAVIARKTGLTARRVRQIIRSNEEKGK